MGRKKKKQTEDTTADDSFLSDQVSDETMDTPEVSDASDISEDKPKEDEGVEKQPESKPEVKTKKVKPVRESKGKRFSGKREKLMRRMKNAN